MRHASTDMTVSVSLPRRRKRLRIRGRIPNVACVFAVAATSFMIGCAPLMDAQSNLVVQARRGIEVAQANRASCAEVHEQLAKLKRQRLDDAFDADVREREDALTADWVIAHRAAYAAALEAYATQQHELLDAADVARRNLQAVDAALERLQWLQSIQNRWLPPQPEEGR